MPPTLFIHGSLMAVVAVAAIFDLASGKIPNGLTYPAAVLGLGLGGVLGGWTGLGASAIGLAVGFVPLFAFYRMGAGLGGGDVKLMGAAGALCAWPGILSVLFYSFIVAAVLGIVMMIWRGQTWPTLKRIGRTLKSVMLPGVPVVSPSSPESIQVPFAVCVCLGSAWWLIEQALGDSLWQAGRSLI